MQPQENPYQFITDSTHKPKKSLIPNPESQKARIMIVLAGVGILIVLALIVSTLISSASNSGKTELIKAAQQQTELVRISKIGIDRAKDTAAKNLATTTNVSLQSDQLTLAADLKSSGIKLDPKVLALGKDQKTDVLLTNAEQANNFDEVFIKTLQTKLVAYQKQLKIAHDKTDSKKLKATLSLQFTNAGLLAETKK